MKILYISTPAYADCDFPLVKAYQNLGLDITYIITIGPFNRRSTLIDIRKPYSRVGVYPACEFDEFKVYEQYMDLNKVYVSYRNGKSRFAPSTWIENYKLYKFVASQKFDIIHTDDYYKGMRNWIYSLGAKVVVTHHDPFPHTGEHLRKEISIYSHVINNSQGTVLLNVHQLDEFCTMYKISPDNVLINSLGVYDNIRCFVPKNVARKPHNILFFGRISPYKGVEYLCDAMKLVHYKFPDATLTIAGGGKIYFDIKPYEELGYIEVRNYYIGMEELAGLLSRCDFTVCPYTDATQSGVIMTSYSLGKPVIATNVGGIPETVEDGKTGLLVPPKEANQLANAIISLFEDECKLQQMSLIINAEYNNGEKSWLSIAKKYIEYYNSLVKNDAVDITK